MKPLCCPKRNKGYNKPMTVNDRENTPKSLIVNILPKIMFLIEPKAAESIKRIVTLRYLNRYLFINRLIKWLF